MLRKVLVKSFAAVSRQVTGSWVGPLTHEGGTCLEGARRGVHSQTLGGNARLLTRSLLDGLLTRTLATVSCDRLLRTGTPGVCGDWGMHGFTSSAVSYAVWQGRDVRWREVVVLE